MHLPSGRVVGLQSRVTHPRERAPKEPLFSELLALVDGGELALTEGGSALDPRCLELRDFHALRAIATRLGWVAEPSVTLACRNCGDSMEVQACATLELGPFVDGELDDPELDVALDLDEGPPDSDGAPARRRQRWPCEACE